MNFKTVSNEVVSGIAKVSKKKKLELHEPYFFKRDFEIIKKCLKSTSVSSHSKYVNIFEKKICSYTHSKYSVATMNATSALHLSLIALGVKCNDEVIVPNFNYIAPANAVLYCNAVPIFLDIELETFGLDPVQFENYLKNNYYIKSNKSFNKKTQRVAKAVIVTHVFGNPCKIKSIIKISKKYNLKVIEDASEALGSFYQFKHLGTFGDIGVISFNGNKIITTGGGGVVITNNARLFKEIKLISTISKTKKSFWDYSKLGFNFRMPGINAVLGISQLGKLKFIKKQKKKLFKKYLKIFSKNKNFELVKPISNNANYWLISIFLKSSSYLLRDSIIKKCINKKYNARPGWKVMTKMNYFKKYKFCETKNSIEAEKRLVCLPSSWHIMKK